MVTKPTHIDKGAFDLVLTYVPDVVGGLVRCPIRTLDHSAIFIDFVQKQPISHLVWRPEVYSKNSVNCMGAGYRICEEYKK